MGIETARGRARELDCVLGFASKLGLDLALDRDMDKNALRHAYGFRTLTRYLDRVLPVAGHSEGTAKPSDQILPPPMPRYEGVYATVVEGPLEGRNT